LSTLGFLVILPLGALVARWARTFTSRWFNYHWIIQVVFSIPIVITGWALGPLAVADQGSNHVSNIHKICGVLILPLYIGQLCLGSFIHFRKPPYPRRHPPQNFVHAGLGILIIILAFLQTRTGITIEWTRVTGRPIDLLLLSNLWTAWAIFIPLLYLFGFALIPRQLVHEKELPPPYTPRTGFPDPDDEQPVGVRALLGLDAPEVDDGTHDVFSENPSQTRTRSSAGGTNSSNDIEMREISVDRWTPVSLATSR